MKFLQRMRHAWRSFSSSFDYEPPKALAPTQTVDTAVMEYPPITPPSPYSPPSGDSRFTAGPV